MWPWWKHSHITQTVTVKTFISPSTFDPGSRSPLAPSSSGWFHVLPLLSSNPSSSGLSFPPNHTSLIYALSLPGSTSLLSPPTLPHPPFSLYCSVSSSILILINPPFPFPAPSSSLSCRTSLAGPSVEWSYCSLSLSLSLSGAALQGPADWIRAFYSHWVDRWAQMQISAGIESVAVVHPRQQWCLRVWRQPVR